MPAQDVGTTVPSLSNCSLSIIIVDWNTKDLLAECLDSVAAEASGLCHGGVQTIVVDNASTDGSVDMVRQSFPWVELRVNTKNLGFAQANNQALGMVQGRYVLLLNSDTRVQPNSLRKLVDFMDGHPRAGAAGPRLLNADGSLQPGCHPMLTPGREFWRLGFLNRLIPLATYPMDRWDTETPRRVDVIKGACLLLRRSALQEVGPLDEQYFMYTEEVDLCYRLAQAGWELWYLPTAVVTHYGEGSSRQVAEEMYLQLYRSKVQFYRKTGGEGQARRFKRLVTLAYAPRVAGATAAAAFDKRWRTRARTYRRLLAALPSM